jgi:hypothetical protein
MASIHEKNNWLVLPGSSTRIEALYPPQHCVYMCVCEHVCTCVRVCVFVYYRYAVYACLCVCTSVFWQENTLTHSLQYFVRSNYGHCKV